jgi:hypothetical protein
MVNRLGDGVVPDIIGGRFSAQQEMVADVLLDEAVAVVAPDHGMGEVEILDDGRQLPVIAAGDPAPEDHRELVGLADGAIGVQPPLAKFVESGPPVKDQVVAVLNLGEEQPMPTAGLGAFPRGEERGEAGEPFLAAARQVARRQRVGEFLEALQDPALQEGIATLREVDAFRRSSWASQWC